MFTSSGSFLRVVAKVTRLMHSLADFACGEKQPESRERSLLADPPCACRGARRLQEPQRVPNALLTVRAFAGTQLRPLSKANARNKRVLSHVASHSGWPQPQPTPAIFPSPAQYGEQYVSP